MLLTDVHSECCDVWRMERADTGLCTDRTDFPARYGCGSSSGIQYWSSG